MAPPKEAAHKASQIPNAKNSNSRPSVQNDLDNLQPSTRRVSRIRREIDKIEQEEPLQRKILRALADEPHTPSSLVNELDVSKEAISRLLGKLHNLAFVEYGPVAGDARRRLYRLTPEGELAFGRHAAYGSPDPLPPTLDHKRLVALARAGLENALRMRRQANRLEEAVARIQIVLDQARELADNDLLIDTMAELAATLRQARQYPEHEAVILELKQISLGERHSGDSSLALPAVAHCEYELGRAREGGIADPSARARHLDAAQSLYCHLGRFAHPDRRATWMRREAWSILSLASNLRERSHHERAIEKAAWALSRFQTLEDHYGESRSLFTIGLCLRLMGDFRHSWTHLALALEMAQKHTFERFQADTLLQMGDVQRCMGNTDPARSMLSEALAQATRLEIHLIQAFALSSLGACSYQEADFKDARAQFNRASALFKGCAHREGMALNTRRQAVVKYRLNEGLQAGSITTLKRLVGSAHRQYEDLQCPAGAAACEIELGRAFLTLGVKPERPIANLRERLADPRQRDLIELDPWVPTYLLQFSMLADDEALHTVARAVVADAERRRYAWYIDLTGDESATVDEKPLSAEESAIEMAGEPRRATYTLQAPTQLLEMVTSNAAPETTGVGLDPILHEPLFVPARESIPATVR